MGQQKCDAEVKLLLAPAEAEAAERSLHAGSSTVGRVVLYDTVARDLLSHGIILRVRQGESGDLTVKLRLPHRKDVSAISGNASRFKCEIDYAGGEHAYSYSVQMKLKAQTPSTGIELYQQLNKSQRELLSQNSFVIDWKQVQPVADIQSAIWMITSQPPFDKLALEMWKWPDGAVLELSAKAGPAALQATYDQLKALASHKGLTLNHSQQFKTELVLGKAPK